MSNFEPPEVAAQKYADIRENAPEELQGPLLEIEDYWDRKLWHELTDALLTLYHDPASSSLRLELFNNFVLTFNDKINQLKFVRIGLQTVLQLSGELRQYC